MKEIIMEDGEVCSTFEENKDVSFKNFENIYLEMGPRGVEA
jgi:hypothetical protein